MNSLTCLSHTLQPVSHRPHPYVNALTHLSLSVTPWSVSESVSLCAPAGGEQHVPGGPHGEQLGPLHHLAHGGAGTGRHPRARGRAFGLRETPPLQLLREFSSERECWGYAYYFSAVGTPHSGSPGMLMGPKETADVS